MPTDINSNKILGVPGSTNIIHPVSKVKPKMFITEWTVTGPRQVITLPYFLGGTYSGTIDWGDGNTDVNDGSVTTHSYAIGGTYRVTITGDCIGWNFGNIGGSTYITSVLEWGQLKLGANSGGYFADCPNLDISSVSDVLDLTGITNMQNMFLNCKNLISINNINSWNTSTVTTMNSMFLACKNFDQELSFNTSTVTDMSGMFGNCYLFNQTLNFNTSSVILMNSMFYGAIAFDQDIGFWNVASLSQATNFMGLKTPATFSTSNLDAIYNGWSTTVTQIGVTISFNTAKYTPASIAGRLILTGPYGWFITDGGL
jgi:surface protein